MEYLSPVNDDNPQQYDGQNHPGEMTINPLEKVILFICMTRSLKWRVRLVFSLDPMARELTVDHPLFHNTMMHTFLRIAKSIEKKSMRNQAGKKRKRGKHNQKDQVAAQYTMSMANMKTSLSSYLGSESYRDFVWAEVLCQKPKFGKGNATATTTTSHHRWVHVDPTFCLFDEPMKVEMIDLETSSLKQGKNRNRIFKPVSYVLGVENFHDLPEMSSYSMGSTSQWLLNTTKLTDVTPRYANKWSVTLKIRGANAKNIAQGKCVNDWWRQTLQRINHAFVKKRADVGLSTLCMDGARSCSRSRHSRLNHRDISSSTPSYKVETESRGNNKVDILIIDDDEGEGEDMKEQLLASNRNSEKRLNHEQHDVDQTEQREFESMKGQEAIPTNKAAFKNHPLYVIPSMMKKQEVLAPDAKRRISGIFKGEMVYRRSDVSIAFPAKKWLYQGRKVIEKELPKPAKIIKARKKPTPKGFQTLSTYGVTLGKQEDSLKDVDHSLQGEEDANTKLYGIWQTIRWSPPYVGPNDPIPVNEHNNVELALLNPGLAHVELYRIAKVAKQLGIPYAPCLIGFEGHGGNRTPTIRGIVVHRHNVDLLNEAHVEMQSQLVENEVKERQQAIYGRWKRLIKGLLTRDRIAREYAND
jgi:DNA repair protein RAD4